MKLFKNLLSLLIVMLAFTTCSIAQNTIEGYLYYHNDPAKPIPASQATLSTITGQPIATSTTNNLGKYSFTNVPNGTYMLTASTTLSPGGVTLGDSFLILLHLIGVYPLSPIEELAADVNANGGVDWDDYTAITTGWFLNGAPFPVGDWVFTSATVNTGLKDNTNLGGTSAADVNGGYIPNLTKKDEVTVSIESQQNYSGSAKESVILGNSREITGFGLVFDTDPTTIIKSVSSTLDGFEYVYANGQLRMSWLSKTGEPVVLTEKNSLFTVEGENLMLTPSVESHFIDVHGDIVPDVTLKMVTATGDALTIDKVYESGQGTMVIEANANNDQVISICVADMTGRIVYEGTYNLSTGLNKIDIHLTRLVKTGIYTYNVISQTSPKFNFGGKLYIK